MNNTKAYKIFCLIIAVCSQTIVGGSSANFCESGNEENCGKSRCRMQLSSELVDQIKFSNIGRIDKKKHLIFPTDGKPVGLEFIPCKGAFRNQRLRFLILNESVTESHRIYNIYFLVLGRNVPGWEFVESVEIPSDTKQVPIIIEESGNVIVGDKTLALEVL